MKEILQERWSPHELIFIRDWEAFLHDELWNFMSLNEMKQREKVRSGEAHTLILTVPIDFTKSFVDTLKQ